MKDTCNPAIGGLGVKPMGGVSVEGLCNLFKGHSPVVQITPSVPPPIFSTKPDLETSGR